MAAINIIQGTDKEFTLKVIKKSTGDPFDFTGLVTTAVTLTLEGENVNLVLSLTANANGSVLTFPSAIGGKVKASISDLDTANLKKGSALDMELNINEGAGPDFAISKVQFLNALEVKEKLF